MLQNMVAVDEQLMLKGLQNPSTKTQAFDQMVRVHQEMLYHHVRRMVIVHDDADDILQNTFIKAWKYIDSFRGDAKLRTWLYRIATNEALSFLEKQKKRAFTDVENIQDDLRHSLQNSQHIDGDEIQMKLQEAILTLPDRQRTVFHMRYFDELPYDEIAAVLEVTTGSLKASYHHAVKKIEAYLVQHIDDH